MRVLSAFISIRKGAISKATVSPPVALLPWRETAAQPPSSRKEAQSHFNAAWFPFPQFRCKSSHPCQPPSLWKCISQAHARSISAQQQGKRWDSTCWERQSLSELPKGHGAFQHCLTSTAPHVRFNFRNGCELPSRRCGKYKKSIQNLCHDLHVQDFIFYSSLLFSNIFFIHGIQHSLNYTIRLSAG